MNIKCLVFASIVLPAVLAVHAAITPTLNEIESLMTREKYSIALEKALDLLNTKSAELSPLEAGALHYFIGLAYKKSGNIEMAATYLKKINTRFPTSKFVKQSLLELADIYKEDHFQWEAYLEKVFEQFPNTPEAVRAGMELLRANLELKNFKKAVPIVEKMVNLWKVAAENPELYMLTALSYSGINDYIEAVDYLKIAEKEIQKTIDGNPLYVFEAGKIHYNNGNFKRAVTYLNRLFNVFPTYKDIDEATILMADAYEREGNLFMSAVYLIKAVEKKTNVSRQRYELMLNLGKVLGMLGNEELEIIRKNYPFYADAEKLLTTVEKNSPVFEQKRNAAILLSGEFKKAKNFEQMVDNYYRFLEDKRDPLVEKYFKENLDLYIDDLHRKGENDRIFKFWVAIKDRKSLLSPENLLKLGEIFLEMQLYGNAEEIYRHMERYTIFRQQWPAVYRNLARIYFKTGRYSEFLDIRKKFKVKEEPEKSEFLYYTLRACNALNDGEGCIEFYKESGLTAKKIDNLFQYKALEQEGELLERTGETAMALNLYNDMMLYPRLTDARRFGLLLKLADLFYKKGDWVSALDYYERAEGSRASMEPETSEWILFRKIFIFKRTDRKEEAKAALRKLKQLNPDSFWGRQAEKDVG